MVTIKLAELGRSVNWQRRLGRNYQKMLIKNPKDDEEIMDFYHRNSCAVTERVSSKWSSEIDYGEEDDVKTPADKDV